MDVLVFTLNLVVAYLVMDGGVAQSFSSVLLAVGLLQDPLLSRKNPKTQGNMGK